MTLQKRKTPNLSFKDSSGKRQALHKGCVFTLNELQTAFDSLKSSSTLNTSHLLPEGACVKKFLGLVLVAVAGMSGCSNKYESISDEELADRMYECRTVVEQSPGMAIMCDNVVRECKNRREAGHFVC